MYFSSHLYRGYLHLILLLAFEDPSLTAYEHLKARIKRCEWHSACEEAIARARHPEMGWGVAPPGQSACEEAVAPA